MEYLKKNKDLLIKYLFIMISNLLIFILSSFYLKKFVYKDLVVLLLVVVFDMIIYYYKGISKFKPLLDFIVNIIVGFILMLFVDNNIEYANALLSIVLANNIIFMRSRVSDKFFKKSLQYFMVLIYTIFSMFINIITFIILVQM